ncbi:hypothetical protein BDZ91DRAFT_715654 [Kalaharituber pfeilii]|nr:hypothetical protein BDZ91DRAFT_715654 [Kalaharituber pfeilii]
MCVISKDRAKSMKQDRFKTKKNPKPLQSVRTSKWRLCEEFESSWWPKPERLVQPNQSDRLHAFCVAFFSCSVSGSQDKSVTRCLYEKNDESEND